MFGGRREYEYEAIYLSGMRMATGSIKKNGG